MQFRYVVREMRDIERWYEENPIHPSNVMFLDDIGCVVLDQRLSLAKCQG